MATSIYAFNCSALAVALTVRSSLTPYSFPAASAASTPAWIPQGPATAIPWGGTSPSSGQIGFGVNPCVLNDGYNTTTFNIKIPNTVLPTNSLQIYLFYEPPSSPSGNGTVAYVILVDGNPVGGTIAGLKTEQELAAAQSHEKSRK